ncbi:MAG: porin [Hyphomicrobiales bacterium]
MKKSSLKALLAGTVAAGVMSAPAVAADLDVAPAKEYVEVGSFKGSILLPGTGISFKVGGYAKADYIFRFDNFAGSNSANSGQDSSASQFGVGLGGVTGAGGNRTRFHANQSRLNFDARTTTDIGSARAFIEVDVNSGFGNSQSFSNRTATTLRHAYVEIGIDSLGGSLLAGQNWSLFTDFNVYPNILDFNGPANQAFLRQAQLRWTQPLSDALTFAISAENPVGFVAGTNAGVDAVPDFIAALSYKSGAVSGRLSGVVTYQDPNNDSSLPATTRDELLGWGIQASAKVKFGKDSVAIQGIYGQGIGRYIFTGATAGVIDSTNNIQEITQYGGIVHGQHFWSDKLHSSAWFAYTVVDSEDDDVTGARLNTGGSQIYTGANLIYNLRSNLTLGLEGLYTSVNSDADQVDRGFFSVQSSVQFSF